MNSKFFFTIISSLLLVGLVACGGEPTDNPQVDADQSAPDSGIVVSADAETIADASVHDAGTIADAGNTTVADAAIDPCGYFKSHDLVQTWYSGNDRIPLSAFPEASICHVEFLRFDFYGLELPAVDNTEQDKRELIFHPDQDTTRDTLELKVTWTGDPPPPPSSIFFFRG